MSKCPKCKKEINFLKEYQSGEMYYTLDIVKGKPNYEEQEFQGDSKVNEFECPFCSEVLFTDEDEAVKFLKEKLE